MSDLRQRLLAHPIYSRLTDAGSVRLFMRFHVFAVWDFMNLVKSLQQSFTCLEFPWVPSANPVMRRFVNEVVLDEESDIGPTGLPQSHFEIYLDAMRESGACTKEILGFLAALESGRPVDPLLLDHRLPHGVARFVGSTLRFARDSRPHVVAAVFAYGREDVIPEMFRRLVVRLDVESKQPGTPASPIENGNPLPTCWSTLLYYLERHIECDGEKHGPLAKKCVSELCGNDPVRWHEAEAAARESIEERILLWDAVVAAIDERANTNRRTATDRRPKPLHANALQGSTSRGSG